MYHTTLLLLPKVIMNSYPIAIVVIFCKDNQWGVVRYVFVSLNKFFPLVLTYPHNDIVIIDYHMMTTVIYHIRT